MGKDGNGSLSVREDNAEEERKCTGRARDDSGSKSESEKDRKPSKTKRKAVENSDSDSESGSDSGKERKRCRRSEKGRRKSHRKSRKRRGSEDEDSESESDYSSQSESEYSDSEGSKSESESESEEERRRRRKRKKRREREEERDRKRRRKDKEKRRRRREKEEEREKKRKEKRKKKKEKLERGKRGAVTNSWGKYGIIRETDMWNKRPEFTAWLAEVKQVNLESLPTWEEKQMFKEFMEDHNTATFPSKKYYNLDAYFKRQMEKEQKKGFKKVLQTERTVFNDEEQRRLELQQAREKQKEEQVEALKRSMQGGMAQAMREQAQLKEEMVYQYKLGNFEAAAAIQRRLDPDVAM